MMNDKTYKNLAFITYARRSDAELAGRLQKELESYAVPSALQCDRTILAKSKFLRPIFRDHTDLNTHDSAFEAQLERELRASRYLILLCSPTSAASPYVDREVRVFLDSHGNDSSSVLPIVASGDVTASDGPTNCFPPALREHRAALLSRNLPLVRDCVGPELMLKTAAWILRVDYAQLHERFRHQQRKRRGAIAATLFFVVAVLSVLGWRIRSQQVENQELAVERDRQEALAATEKANAARKSYQSRIRQAANSLRSARLEAAREALQRCEPELRDWEWYYLQTELDQSLIRFPSIVSAQPLAIGPQHDKLALFAPDHSIQVRSLKDFAELRRIPTGFKRGSTVAWSPDGRWLAAGSFSGDDEKSETAVWDAESGREVWRKPTAGVMQMEFAGDSRRLVISAPNYGAIQSFDAATGDESNAMSLNGNPAGKFALSKTGDRIAAIDYDGRRLALFRASDGSTEWMMSIGDINDRLTFADVDISDDGRYVLVATKAGALVDYGGGVRIIDAATGKKQEILGDENGQAQMCRFSPGDGQIAIVRPRVAEGNSKSPGAVEIFNFFPVVGRAKFEKSYSLGSDSLTAFEFRDRLGFLSTGLDGVVRSQIIMFDAPPSYFRGHTGKVFGMAMLPRTNKSRHDVPGFVTWSEDATVRVWSDGRTSHPPGRNEVTIEHAKRPVTLVTHSPDGVTQVLRNIQGPTQLVGVVEAKLTHEKEITDVAFSRDGARVVTGSHDHTAKVWNVADGSLAAHLVGHRDAIRTVAADVGGKVVATGSKDQSVRLWNGETGEVRRVLDGHASGVAEVSFSPSGAVLASGDEQGVIRVWNVAGGDLRYTFTGHAGRIKVLAFSHDGNRLLSAAEGEPARIWNLETGGLAATLDVSGPIEDALFLRSGNRFLTLSMDGEVKVWDARSLELVLEVQLATHQAMRLEPLSDETTILVTDVVGPTIRLSAPTTVGLAPAAPTVKSAEKTAELPTAAKSESAPVAVAVSSTPAARSTPIAAPSASAANEPSQTDTSARPRATARPAAPVRPDVPAGPAVDPVLNDALLNHTWHYFDDLFPPGDLCRFRPDGSWHKWRWNYWITGPREIRVHYDPKNKDRQSGIVLKFNADATKFSGSFTDGRGKLHRIEGTRQ